MVTFISQIMVLIIGGTVVVLAGWGMFAPGKLMMFVRSAMDQHWGMYIAIAVRLVLGLALISVAPSSLFPVVFQVLGWIAIISAVVLAAVGRERVRRLIAWVSERFSASIIRLWLLFGIAFGAFLVYGVNI